MTTKPASAPRDGSRGASPRIFAALILLVCACLPLPARAEIVLTDLTGQTVTLEKPAKRILLGEGRHIFALSLLLDDPVSPIVGWQGDLKRLDPHSYAAYRAKFPAIEQVPLVGTTSAETFSAETALSLRPDLAIMGLEGHGPNPNSGVIEKLREAGIPILFIDFRSEPLEHTVPSIRLLGKALGAEARAERYIAFYEAHRARISNALQEADPNRPKVLMDMRASMESCCFSPGKANLGPFIDFAGGKNIGEDVIPGPLGQLNLEYILAQNPDIYIATGVASGTSAGGAALGANVARGEAEASLAALASRRGIKEIAAVKQGRVHGLWHNFYNSPLNILALEALAVWIHPDLFAGLDPGETEAEINRQFLQAVPMQGTYWATLDKTAQ